MVQHSTHDDQGGFVCLKVLLKLLDISFLCQPANCADVHIVGLLHRVAAVGHIFEDTSETCHDLHEVLVERVGVELLVSPDRRIKAGQLGAEKTQLSCGIGDVCGGCFMTATMS